MHSIGYRKMLGERERERKIEREREKERERKKEEERDEARLKTLILMVNKADEGRKSIGGQMTGVLGPSVTITIPG